MPRYMLTIAYDGTDFCGWQKQEPPAAQAEATGSGAHVDPTLETGDPGRVALRTVQAIVERAVREVVREPVMLFGASRTDSGVHARGQVAAFTATDDPALQARGSGWPLSRGTDALRRAINGRLPDDVLVTDARPVPGDFDPIGDCIAKGYSYTIHASRERPLWDRRYVHQVWEPLEIQPMRDVAAELVGEHDFAAFAAAGHGRQSTIRTVHALTVAHAIDAQTGQPLEDRIRIDISGSGFLWNMVRIIAGTLADAGRGRADVARIRDALRTGDRRLAGPTFPASGLCLEWITYKQRNEPPHAESAS
ncbi:MAG: tRNA pseudouridine synthase A [Phycisphaeraceae bacterium]|nr:MAG: tRNA pseudouridine synthase A [Phycisphaeraceae bacterium]